jgi:hypothetical protein
MLNVLEFFYISSFMGELAIHMSFFHDFLHPVKYIRSIINLLQFLLLYVYVFDTFILQTPVFILYYWSWHQSDRSLTFLLHSTCYVHTVVVHFGDSGVVFMCGSEEFEDTKGVIRIRILKKNRQHNDQKKKDKNLQNIHIKLKIE